MTKHMLYNMLKAAVEGSTDRFGTLHLVAAQMVKAGWIGEPAIFDLKAAVREALGMH